MLGTAEINALVAPAPPEFNLSADLARCAIALRKAFGVSFALWDAHTGEQLFELNQLGMINSVQSNDGRFIAMFREDERPRLVEWQTGEHWDFEKFTCNFMEFTAKNRWLICRDDDLNCLIDVAARKIVKRSKSTMTISGDERFLFLAEGPEYQVSVWNLDETQPCGVLPLTRTDWQVSHDGQLLVEPLYDENDGQTGVNIWDVAKRERRFKHLVPKPGWVLTKISPDGRRLAVWSQLEQRKTWLLEIIDVNTGNVLGNVKTPHRPNEERFRFSPDSRLLSFVTRKFAGMADAESGQVLWQRHIYYSSDLFAKNADIMLRQDEPNKWADFIDTRSGKFKAAIPVTFYDDEMTLTPDGRHCVISGKRYRNDPPRPWERWLDTHCPWLLNSEAACVVVMETATWRELFRTVNRGEIGHLSADGSTLATSENLGTSENAGPVVVRIWDLSPAKAYLWAIGAALATALGICSSRKFWHRQASG